MIRIFTRCIIIQLVLDKLVGTYNCSHNEVVILSLGTGKSGSYSFPSATGKLGAITSDPTIIDLMMSASSDGVDTIMASILNDRYLRVQTSLERKVDLCDISEDNLNMLNDAAYSQEVKIEQITDFLVRNYDSKRDDINY